MNLLGILVGVREDLPLYRKWWHRLAIAGAWFSSIFVVLVVTTIGAQRQKVEVTTQTTLSLPLLSFTKGRPGVTTLENLRALSGVGIVQADGHVDPLPRVGGPEDIRCSTPAAYKAGESFTFADPKKPAEKLSYRAISDSADQPPDEPRHCAATRAYASLTADRIVAYQFDSSVLRRTVAKGAWYGALALPVWLFLYWNVYYRGLVPIYARRRSRRTRSRFHTPSTL